MLLVAVALLCTVVGGSFFFTLVTAATTAAAAAAVAAVPLNTEGVVNYQVKRVTYLNSPVLREEYSIVVGLEEGGQNIQQPVHNYYVVIPPSVAGNLAHVGAILDNGGNSSLPVKEMLASESCPMGSRCFVINFPEPLTIEKPKITFGLGLSYVNRTKPLPSLAPQDSPLGLYVESSPYFYSPYVTLQQKTVLLLIREFTLRHIKCPEPRNLTPTTSPSAVGGIPGSAQFTCGLYQNVPPLSDDPRALWVSFTVTKVPFFKIKKLERSIELDPLHERLLVTEEYEIAHQGHLMQDGSFSKLEFLRLLRTSGFGSQVIPIIPISIPKDASDLKFRDEVGLLHAPFRIRASPMNPNTSQVVEMTPRFPLNGGWSFYWKMTFTLPYAGFVDRVKLEKEGGVVVKRLVIPLFEIFHDVFVEQLKVNVILPGEVTIYGDNPIVTGVDNFITNRESSNNIPTALRLGRKQVHTIDFKNIVKEHEGLMAVLFDYPWWAPYRQLILTTIVITLTIILLSWLSSLDISLDQGYYYEPEKRKAHLAKLFRQRRVILEELEVFRSTNKTVSTQLLEQLTKLTEQLEALAATDETENNTFKSWQLSLAALRRLYEEQSIKLKSILLTEPNCPTMSRLEKDSVDIDERILQCQVRMLSF